MPFDGQDFIIANAQILDGSGERASYQGDLVISGGKILAVREKKSPYTFPSLPVYDAKGAFLAPGWIDTHTHSDMSLFAAPEAESSITQGVTSQVTGNCGLSPFPAVTDEVREHLDRLYEKYGQKILWKDFSGYASMLEKCMPATNIVPLCGHNTLKACVCGYEGKRCSRNQMEEMCLLLSASFRAGAKGLSTGLLYMPGRTSSEEELLLLMKVLKEYDLPYATHLRSESDMLLEALKEALFLAENGSCKLQISHLKTAGEHARHKLSGVFALLEEAQAKGVLVTCDRYPWTYSATSLSVILPGIYQEMTDAAIEKKLAMDHEECMRLAAELDRSGRDWKKVILADTRIPEMKKFCGKDFSTVAEALSLTEGRSVLKILAEDASCAMGSFGTMCEKNLIRILEKDYVSCGSDETSRPFSERIGRSHPRAFSSFPLFFRYLRSSGIPLEKAVARMTSLPAKIFSLPERGLIREGFYADLLLFDPETFDSHADFTHPHLPAEGVKEVFVNGRICDLTIPVYKRVRNGKILKNTGQGNFYRR